MKILASNQPVDESTARTLAKMQVSINVDALLADRLTLGQIRMELDAMPKEIGEWFELAYFHEVGKRYQAGKAPWHLVTFFAPAGMPQGISP